MPRARPPTILCIATYVKGQEFLRAAKAEGCRVMLLTAEKLRSADWPSDCVDEFFYLPEDLPLEAILHAVSYTARSQEIERIVALDEFDAETAAALREHLRVPGMGLTTMRYFRDKLAMRARAKEAGVRVPEFVHVLNYDRLREFMERVSAPWILKPRLQAASVGLQKVEEAKEIWPLLEKLGDKQSFYLLEQFIPGDVYHVDSIVYGQKPLFAATHAYDCPPFETAHQGGIFATRTLPPGSAKVRALEAMNREVIKGLGLNRGVAHSEFIEGRADGQLYFLECGARVGGAYISNMVEAATGINLWKEWARVEIAGGKEPYRAPKRKKDYAAVILSLARQEEPDTSAYDDPEIGMRIKRDHHAGFVLRSAKPERIRELLESYRERFRNDFYAFEPAPDKPTS
jgi:biotin carboxylase